MLVQSLCLQRCVGRLQSPLWTPLAAVPGDPTTYIALDDAHIQNSGSYSTLMERIRRKGVSLSRLTPVWRVSILIFTHIILVVIVWSDWKHFLECGGQLEGSSGVFQSPGYPHSYPHRHMCLWTITVPEGRWDVFWRVSLLNFFCCRRVRLTFLDFDLEPPSFNSRNNKTSCYYDYIMVSAFSSLPFSILWYALSWWDGCFVICPFDMSRDNYSKRGWLVTDDPWSFQRQMDRPIYSSSANDPYNPVSC